MSFRSVKVVGSIGSRSGWCTGMDGPGKVFCIMCWLVGKWYGNRALGGLDGSDLRGHLGIDMGRGKQGTVTVVFCHEVYYNIYNSILTGLVEVKRQSFYTKDRKCDCPRHTVVRK